jgi:hypothetical protein
VAEATGDGPGPTDAEGAGWVDGTEDADAVGDGKGPAALDPGVPLGTALGTALGSGATVQPDSATTSNRLAATAAGRRSETKVMAASILMVDMSARKRLLALTSASLAAVLLLSGCAAGAAPRDASAEPGEEAHCDLLTGARRTVDYHLSLLLALDDPAAMEELSGSDAPFRIDPGAFRTAVEALSMLSGTEGEMNRLRRIGQLLEERAGMEDPFAQGSDTGKQLAELANGAFGEVRVGLDTALQTVGCRVR